jgi:hypothetical protein
MDFHTLKLDTFKLYNGINVPKEFTLTLASPDKTYSVFCFQIEV